MSQDYVNPSQIYKRLVDSVMNENNCDELLPYQSSVINYFVTQIQHFDNLLKQSKNLEPFTAQSHQLEIERIKFLIHRYMERRLKKIEQNSSILINLIKDNRQTAVNLMSIEEMTYLQRYVSDIDCYLNDVLLKKMPPNMQLFNLSDIQPDSLNEYCKYNFVRANKDTSVIVEDPIEGSQVVDLKKDDQYLLPFSSLKPSLFSNNNDLTLL